MNTIKSNSKEIIFKRYVTYKGLENNELICDIEWTKPRKEKMYVFENGKKKLKTKTIYDKDNDVRIKLDENNKFSIIEKLKIIPYKDKILIKYRMNNADRRKTENWHLLEVFNQLDLWKTSNEKTLIYCREPQKLINKYETNFKQKTKRKNTKDVIIAEKDKRINELEVENAQLRLQIQKLKEKENLKC